MHYDTLSSEEQVSYLIKPIIEVLQAAGGQLERSEIRSRISELDERITPVMTYVLDDFYSEE